MKKTIYFIGIIAALALNSCSLFDDYLDVIPKGELVLENVQDYADMLNLETYTFYPNSAIDGLSDEVWVNPEFMIQSDVLNYSKINYLYLEDPVKYNRITYMVGTGDYVTHYNAIARYNIILTYIDDAKGDDQLREQTKAEARLLVAFRHFYLVNTYAKPYNPATAATDLAVPIRDEFNVEKQMTQATVKEVYDFIEKTIDEAIPGLSNTPVNPYHPSLAAGWALKAKVHFQKQEYALAKAAALESYKINHQLFDLVDYCNKNKGKVVNAEQPENMLFGMFSSVDRPTLAPPLRQLFEKEPDDCRFDPYFFKPDDPKAGNVDDNAYTSRYQLQGTQFAMNTSGLRTSEAMLILAECYAREGNLQEAMSYINQLREKRIKNYASKEKPSPTKEEDAMKIILEERRKELLFGHNRFLDIRRLSNDPKYAIVPTKEYPANPNSAYGSRKEYKLNPTSYMLIAPIPWVVLEQDTYMKNNTPEIYVKR